MLLGLLGVILVSAKVFGYTTLSWMAVTAPFWIPLAISLGVMFVGFAAMLFAAIIAD